MASLESAWKRVRFVDMVTSAGATRKARGWSAGDAGVDRYVGLEHLDANSPKIRRWASTETVGENSDLRPFETGDVILARRGIEQRKVGVAEFRGVASGHALVFRAQPEVVLPEFLPYFLLSDVFMDRALEFSAGSLSKTVNLSALMRQEFALPPLEEQRRLALLLQAIDRTRTRLAQLTSNARALRLAALHDLYTPKAGWTVAALGERYEVQLGKKLSHETGAEYEPLPYLRNANVQWNALWLDDVATMPFNLKERQKYRLRHGDILACEGRHVGKAAMWRGELDEAYYQMSLHRLRPREPAMDVPAFMLYYLEYCSVTGLLAAATGATTIPHLSAERFAAIRLAFPSLEGQERIARKIVELDAGVRSAEQQVVQTRRLLNQALQTTLVAA